MMVCSKIQVIKHYLLHYFRKLNKKLHAPSTHHWPVIAIQTGYTIERETASLSSFANNVFRKTAGDKFPVTNQYFL